MTMTFQEFNLQDNILRAIEDLGFETPSPIQEKTIPILLVSDTDMIALAQTGTGKTAAFGFPILQNLDENNRKIQALILSPTRELCMQTQEELERYGKYINRLKTLAVYGGAPIGGQMRTLKSNPQIVVATPGRLIDLINRGVVDLSHVRTVVLDEADEMLNMGFRDDIDFILSNSPARTGTWLFSATMNKDVRRISKRYMTTPKEISVARENAGSDHIDHQYFVINAHQRYEALCRLLDFTPDIYGIIFTRTKLDAQDLAEKLNRRDIKVGALHGDMDQKARTKVMDKFKQGQFRLIAATDVAARGIDVNNMTHVINYELPEDPEIYTHRSGRTARAGKSGICMSLVTSREIRRIHQVERLSKTTFHKGELPDNTAVIRKKLNHFFAELESAEPSEKFVKNTKLVITKKMAESDAEGLLQKILWLQFKDLVEDNSRSKNLNVGSKQSLNGSDKGHSQRMFINLGAKEGMDPKRLITYIAEMTAIEKDVISDISISELSSFFNVSPDAVSSIKNGFKDAIHKGRRVRVEEAEPQPTFNKFRNKGGVRTKPRKSAYKMAKGKRGGGH